MLIRVSIDLTSLCGSSDHPMAVALGMNLFNSKLGEFLLATLEPGSDWASGLGSTPLKNISWNLKADLINKEKDEAIAVVIPKERTEKLLESIHRLDYYEEQKKWSKECLKKIKAPMTTCSVVHVPTLRLCKKLLNNIDSAFVTELNAYPEQLHEVFNPQFFLFQKGVRLQAANDYALVEAFFIFSGSCYIFGVKRNAVAGANQDEKYETVAKMKGDDFLKKARSEDGFMASMTPGVGLVVPANYVVCVVQVSSEDCAGLRIQHLPKKRKAECVEYMQGFVGLHPEQNAGRVKDLIEFLTSDEASTLSGVRSALDRT